MKQHSRRKDAYEKGAINVLQYFIVLHTKKLYNLCFKKHKGTFASREYVWTNNVDLVIGETDTPE